MPAAIPRRSALRGSVVIAPGPGSTLRTFAVAREGYFFFVLGSMALVGGTERHAAVHREFERGITITKTSDEVVDDMAIAAGFDEVYPFMKPLELRQFFYSLLDGSSLQSRVGSIALAQRAMLNGRGRLRDVDRTALDGYQGKTAAALTADESAARTRIEINLLAENAVSPEDRQHSAQLSRKAAVALSPGELADARRLTSQAMGFGLVIARAEANTEGAAGVIGGVPGGVPGGEVNTPPPLDPPDGFDKAPSPSSEVGTGSASRPQRVSGGVLAGRATKRVQASYPEMAKAARLEGPVVVEVRVSETGLVTSARAISGHPLLRDAAVEAARGWEFEPYLLNGAPVPVIGTITFIFRKNTPPPATP